MTTGDALSTQEHLAEMDRLLRDIQVELAPEREPPPALEPARAGPEGAVPEGAVPEGAVPDGAVPEPPLPPPVEPPPPPDPGPPPIEPPPPAEPPPPPPVPSPALAMPAAPAAASELSRHLLASMRELLAGYEELLTGSPPARRTPRHRSEPAHATVSAGPFPSLEALREFEAAVAGLPAVREVTLRAYEGADHAALDVRLDHTNA